MLDTVILILGIDLVIDFLIRPFEWTFLKLNRFPVRYRDLIQSCLDSVTMLFHIWSVPR